MGGKTTKIYDGKGKLISLQDGVDILRGARGI